MILEAMLALVLHSSSELEIPPTTLPTPISSVQELPLPLKPQQSLENDITEVFTPEVASSTFLGLISVAQASSTPIYCSCVRTARLFNPSLPLKDAKDLVPNGEPVIGGVIQFYYPKSDTWHVSIIEGFTKEGFLVVEGNFSKCDKTRRLVYYNDPFIKGFIK